ncbi:MAG: WD40/YVTN/BNR-like repeat-containing protein [Candidatus Acidiferrum sp.]
MNNLRRSLPFLLVAVAAVCVHATAASHQGAAQTQQFDQKIFTGLHWRMIGPFRAGRALAVTGVRGQADVYYFGSVEGGVWRTNDAGRTWNPIFDGEPVASIGAIAVAPSNANIIYVGTGEADMRSSVSTGNGMYKSTDAGKTWEHIGLEDSQHISRILVDPKDPDKLFVAALGHAYGPNKERGVYRSNDGGKTWEQVLFKDENTGAIDLAMEPGNPKIMYAALLQTRRPPWAIYPPSKGPGTGLYRSKDGGAHWEQLTGHGLPSEELGRMGIAFAPSNPKRIYLIADAKEGGLYRSDDGGENWTRLSKDPRIWGRGWYFDEVSVDSKDEDTVYIPNTSLYRSRDGGKTFTAIKGAPGGDDYHQLWIDPDNPQRMILGVDQGVIVTRNGGETWSSWYNQPTGQFYQVSTDNRFPYWVYGAEQDSGAAATPSRSWYRALNFHDWRPMEAGGESDYTAADPLHPEIVYGGTVARQNFHNEQIQFMPPTLLYPADADGYRKTWTLPLVFSEVDPHVLYFSSQVLFRTANGGNTWQKISPDLTRKDPGAPANLDPATAADAPTGQRRGVIYTIAPSPKRIGEIWTGTDDGLVQLTRDEGKTWHDVTPPELTPWSKVTHIAASHFEIGEAYAAVDRHRLDDTQPYLYRTKDFGKTWQRVSNGIPDGSFLNCVRDDPKVAGLLYACTEKGVYISYDDGDNWSSLQLNMPTVSVRDLVVHDNDLVIATFGRAFWVLDDITSLRQWNAKAAHADAWLFTPQTAYRVRPGSDEGTPIPLDEPQADNPPAGAVLDYYLKEAQTEPVKLEIFDAAGKLVRRYSSADEIQKTNPDTIDIPMYWFHDVLPPSAEAGMHRFVWDLRYASAGGRRRSRRGGGGPLAVPGHYTVKLTAAGKTMSAPMMLKMDPNVKVTTADLQRQFLAASKLAAGVGEFSAAAQRADDLQKEIAARGKEA